MLGFKHSYVVQMDVPSSDVILSKVLDCISLEPIKDHFKDMKVGVINDKGYIYRQVDISGFEGYSTLCMSLEDQGFRTVRKTRRTKDFDDVFRYAPNEYNESS